MVRVVNRMPAGDHILFLAEALTGVLQAEEGEPMVRVRSNGLSY